MDDKKRIILIDFNRHGHNAEQLIYNREKAEVKTGARTDTNPPFVSFDTD